jgi:ABC-type bacteriocin/lantibiotic exporter with double-glycine peptidase domain
LDKIVARLINLFDPIQRVVYFIEYERKYLPNLSRNFFADYFMLKFDEYRRNRMEDAANQVDQAMTLRDAFKKYAICLVLFIVVMTIAIWTNSGVLTYITLFVYGGCGVFLNRTVLRNLIEWHPMYNTIGNVSSAKLKQAILWPISYLSLFIRLGINKVL